ncbi:MAG: thioredoxin fold domain-containing protein [Gammaproteobacteria bacterium]|nr:thioredoxin fold domain-containing protein [Gammaproteobacteria bacterium]
MTFGARPVLAVLLCLSWVGAGADDSRDGGGRTPSGTRVEVAPSSRDPMTHFFEQSFGNLKDELALARKEGKAGVFVMFSDPDCPWCDKMKATVLNRPAVQEYYRRHFRLLHLDTRGDTLLTDFSGREMTEKDFAFKEHRVRATPVFIFFGLDGKPLLRYTGATRDVDEFLWLGEFVVSGAYKTRNFTVYKRERLAGKK